VLSQFVLYDFKRPTNVPPALFGAFAAVVLDPPYLNADTLRAFASTVLLIVADPSVPVMLCTGSIMCATARTYVVGTCVALPLPLALALAPAHALLALGRPHPDDDSSSPFCADC
jgi:hypothetical protein